MHLTSLESHLPPDRCGTPSFAATVLSRSALGLDASTFNASACHRLRDGCAVPPGLPTEGFRLAHRGSPGSSRQQRGRNGCAVHFNFQRTIEGKNTPSLFMPKNEGVERIYFLFFEKIKRRSALVLLPLTWAGFFAACPAKAFVPPVQQHPV